MDTAEQAIRAELAALVDAVRAGSYDVAIAGLKEFLQTHPDHEVAMGLLAASYFQLGMRDRAGAFYEQLLASHPDNALARFQLGLLHLAADPVAALSTWTPLLQLEHEFMAHFHSALAHLQLGDREAAWPMLEHAAKYMPDAHPLRDQLNQLRSSYSRGGPLP